MTSRTAQIRAQQQACLLAANARNAELTAQQARLATGARLAHDARRFKKVKGGKVAPPALPAIALELEYRRRLERIIDDMNRSVAYWLKSAYRKNEPELIQIAADGGMLVESAPDSVSGSPGSGGFILGSGGDHPPLLLGADALPAKALQTAIRKLSRQWQSQFNEAARELARWFSMRSYQRSTDVLQRILRKGGWSVELKLTQAQRDILAATVHQNVSLIRSIPQRYFTEIEGMVMRSVMAGRDLQQLTNDLQRQYGVTRRRATLIARDQNNKTTASMNRARHIELGIEEAVWMHSGAGKVPRPTHVRNHGNKYNVKEGWYDPAVRRKIMPGELINCRCFSRPVIPGFS